MKKLICLVVLAALPLGGSLFAAGKGGFVDPAKGGGFLQTGGLNIEHMSVAGVKRAADDTIVGMKGRLVEQLDDDKYLFKGMDSSQTIVVEIDEDKWRGLTVTPSDVVILVGEVDKDDGKVKVDVKRIRKVDDAKSSEAKGKADKSPAAVGCANCGCAASAAAKP